MMNTIYVEIICGKIKCNKIYKLTIKGVKYAKLWFAK